MTLWRRFLSNLRAVVEADRLVAARRSASSVADWEATVRPYDDARLTDPPLTPQATRSQRIEETARLAGDMVAAHHTMQDLVVTLGIEMAAAGLIPLADDEGQEALAVAFQRRQDRFPQTPILNRAGFYAERSDHQA